MRQPGPAQTVHRHIVALVLFPLLAFAWVGDTLFLGYDLSAFDVIFRLPHWKAEHEYRGVQQIILSDSPQAHYPERALKWRAARQGERIDLNPYIFTGVPELSQGVGAFITSPFQLFMDVSEAIDWSTWFRLAAAGLIMYGFLVTVGVDREPAILGGVIWAFNLHQLVWLEFPQHLATQLWIPALLCFNYLILCRGLTWERILGILVTNAFLFTSDYTQITLYTYVAVGLFNTIYLAADTRLSAGHRIRRWLTVHSVFVLSALLLVPELIVEMHTLKEGLRSHQPWRVAEDISWSPATIALMLKDLLPDIADFKRFFSPNAFGGLWGESYRGKQYFGNVVLGSAYCGIVVFLLTPVCLAWLKTPARRPLVLASFGVLLFAFGMIHRDPVLVKLFNIIPMGGVGGYPRYITIVAVLLSLTTAMGLHILMRLDEARARRAFWSVFAVVLMVPLAARAVDPNVTLSNMSYPLAALLIIGLAVGGLCIFGRWRYVAVLLTVATVVDLFVVTYGFNPRMEDHRNFVTTETLERLIADDGDYRVAQVSRNQLYPPNLLQYYGIPSIGGYLTVAPYRYIRFVQETVDDYHVTSNGQLYFFDANLEVFRLLNVKYILSQERRDDPRLEMVREAPGYWMYRLKNSLSRVYCGSDLLTFDSEARLLTGFKSIARKYDRPVALVGDGGEAGALTADCEVRDIETRLNGVAFTVDTDHPTYVFAPYNFSGNWKARSGEEKLSVLEASYNFLAIPVDPGVRRIELEYLDTANLIFSYLLIGLGIVVVVWFAVSPTRTLTSGLLALSGVVLIGYSLLEVPGIANTDLPERPAAHVVRPDGD